MAIAIAIAIAPMGCSAWVSAATSAPDPMAKRIAPKRGFKDRREASRNGVSDARLGRI
jgi:hypothetical protein